ncbi:MAG: DUF3522 domain-containing protein [Nitrospinaceae bacterium]|nr:DUF3522 domain-containing protein [Nitrospinaceae bacterium]
MTTPYEGAVAFEHLTHAQWFVLLSNVAFFLTAWFALRRKQWIRTVGFVLVVPASFVFHLAVDTTVIKSEFRWEMADTVASVYMSVTIVMLMAHFHNQLTELVIELCMVPIIVWVSYLLVVWSHPDWKFIFPPLAVFVVIVVPTWLVHGLPPARIPWLMAGLVLTLTGVAFFMFTPLMFQKGPQYRQRDLVFHGLWHLLSGVGSGFLIYALRDPHLLNDYTFMGDIV